MGMPHGQQNFASTTSSRSELGVLANTGLSVMPTFFVCVIFSFQFQAMHC